jgi:hypothetical protein
MALVDQETPANIYNLYQQLVAIQANMAIQRRQISELSQLLLADKNYLQYASADEQALVQSLIQPVK